MFLNDLCTNIGFELCTGAVTGDLAALPTYRHQPTRPDHIIASPEARLWLQHCRVNPHRRDSDHHPLEAVLAPPWVVQPATPVTGVPLYRLRWDSRRSSDYSDALQPAAIDAVCAAATADDAALSFDLLHAEATRAASVAGMPLRPPRSGPDRAPRVPWFDAECRHLRTATRRCASRSLDSEVSRALRRHYSSFARRKHRAWAVRRAQALCQMLKRNPRHLYACARAMPLSLPVALLAPSHWWDFVANLARGPEQPAVHLPPLVPGQPSADPDAALAVPFAEAAVLAALKHLKNGRSAGAHGWPAELLRYGYGPAPDPNEPPPHLLAPAVTALLTGWLRTGIVPPAANCSLVVPIHKRGDVVQPTHYRPIAVGEPLMRLYGALLNSRLVLYTESKDLRAPSQTGFRPRLSTLHQIFALQHLIDRAVHLRQPLFCCFLDLKGAYDRVPRVLLWQALARLGVPDTLLAAIQSLYHNTDYAISVGGRRGASARSACGVKQGCPLSPTLFGLLLDGLHWALMAGAPAAGPLLACGRRVPDLGYADDFCLLSSSPAGLQQLLHIAHGFLTSIGMELSLDKTRVVVFGATPVDAGAPAQWTCGGIAIQRVQEYKYLGVLFSAKLGLAATFTRLRGCLNGAWVKLQKQFGVLHDGISLALMRAMCQQGSPPAGSYACELWGVRRLSGPGKKARKRLGQTHVQLWRRLLRLSKTVHQEIVLRELAVRSPQAVWLRSTCRFWNALCAAPDGSLQRAVALSDWDDAISQQCEELGLVLAA